jgi:hypothetical protein
MLAFQRLVARAGIRCHETVIFRAACYHAASMIAPSTTTTASVLTTPSSSSTLKAASRNCAVVSVSPAEPSLLQHWKHQSLLGRSLLHHPLPDSRESNYNHYHHHHNYNNSKRHSSSSCSSTAHAHNALATADIPLDVMPSSDVSTSPTHAPCRCCGSSLTHSMLFNTLSYHSPIPKYSSSNSSLMLRSYSTSSSSTPSNDSDKTPATSQVQKIVKWLRELPMHIKDGAMYVVLVIVQQRRTQPSSS